MRETQSSDLSGVLEYEGFTNNMNKTRNPNLTRCVKQIPTLFIAFFFINLNYIFILERTKFNQVGA